MAPTTATARKTTRKPAAKPDTAIAETEIPDDLFDSWSEEAEEAALAALADSFKYVVVEGTFIGRFSDGERVRIPLEFEASVFENLDEGSSGIEQLKDILAALGDRETAERIVSKPFTQMTACATLYFDVVERVTNQTIAKFKRASLGE